MKMISKLSLRPLSLTLLLLCSLQPVLASDLVVTPEIPTFALAPIGKHEPTVGVLERDALRQVSDLLKADKLDDAKTELRLALSRSQNAALWYTLAGIEQQQGHLAKASEALLNALKELPEFTRAQVQLAGIFTAQKQYLQARPWLQKAIAREASAPLYGMLGYGYLMENNLLPAQAAYQQALLLDANNDEYLKALLQINLGMDDFAGAEQALNVLLDRTLTFDKTGGNADISDLYLLRANLALKQGLDAKAINSLNLARAFSTSAAAGHKIDWQLAQLYLKQGVFESAFPLMKNTMNANTLPDWSSLHSSLEYLIGQQQYKTVAALSTRLLQRDLSAHRQSELYTLLGKVNFNQGKVQQAEAYYDKSLNLDALNGRALLGLAQLFEVANPQQAEQLLQRAADIPSVQVQALTMLAQNLVARQAYERALVALKQLEQLAPTTPGLEENLQTVTNLVRLASL